MYQSSSEPFLGFEEFSVSPTKYLTKQLVWSFVKTAQLTSYSYNCVNYSHRGLASK